MLHTASGIHSHMAWHRVITQFRCSAVLKRFAQQQKCHHRRIDFPADPEGSRDGDVTLVSIFGRAGVHRSIERRGFCRIFWGINPYLRAAIGCTPFGFISVMFCLQNKNTYRAISYAWLMHRLSTRAAAEPDQCDTYLVPHMCFEKVRPHHSFIFSSADAGYW